MVDDKAKLFFTSKTVKPLDRSNIVSVPTGIAFVDQKIVGLNKQEISVFSGVRSAGKSTILTQMALEVVNRGKKVALFSGEMNEQRTFDWIYLIAAGRSNVVATRYENYFDVIPEAKHAIAEWLSDSLYLYNNDFGNDVEKLFFALQDCIVKKGVDVVILDNLMSIDMGAEDNNKNAKQTAFIWRVKQFAKTHNVHIILVAHPRKIINGIIRIEDVSGTADLTNAADNVFLLHRVGFDFKRNAKAMFRWSDDYCMMQVDAILEIAKNRYPGVMDEMAGLYFDRTCKQLTGDGSEKVYNWTKLLQKGDPF